MAEHNHEMTGGVVTRNWATRGIWSGVRRTLRQPGDLMLAARIGLFLVTVPRRMQQRSLSDLLAGLDAAHSQSPSDPQNQVERISRLRQAWLASPLMSARNTCYVRALTLYTFLDPGADEKRIHFGVESGMDEGDRIHGHAWVTLGGKLLEPPEPVLAGRVRELYSYPPQSQSGVAV